MSSVASSTTSKRSANSTTPSCLFTSDNGGSGEGGLHGTFNENGFFNGVANVPLRGQQPIQESVGQHRSRRLARHRRLDPGGQYSVPILQTERPRGGNADALIVSWPKGIDKKHHGQIRNQYHHIIDIAPTILEACGVEAPKVIDGVEQMPFDGVPMNYTFADPEAKDKRTVQYYEMFGNRGIYADGWTAVTLHRGKRPVDPHCRRHDRRRCLGTLQPQRGLLPEQQPRRQAP